MAKYTRGAAIYGRLPKFQRFLASKCGQSVECSQTAAVQVRALCGVSSRRELDSDPGAGRRWRALVQDFNRWMADKGGR